jgi:hypothetical protein
MEPAARERLPPEAATVNFMLIPPSKSSRNRSNRTAAAQRAIAPAAQ